ncbi:MAG: IclR family transcriptional regulator [Chloroflexota bacterium]
MPKQNPGSPQSVFGKISAIFDQFTLEKPVLTLAEITNGTNISKPTVFRLLQELTELGYVSQEGKTYRLGLASFRLGMIAKNQMRLSDFLDDLLGPVAQATAETVITATLDRDEIFYLHVIESLNPLRFVAGAGTKRPIPFGATGMALLSLLERETQQAILRPPFTPFTDKTIVELDHYLARLEQVRSEAVVIESGEYYEGIMAVAVPVSVPDAAPLTFTVVGPEDRVLPISDLIVDQLQKAAAAFYEARGSLTELLPKWVSPHSTL